MSNARLVLKILSGTYAGAELVLAGSTYVLGRSLDCDISVEDEQLAQETLRIEVLAPNSIKIDILSNEKKIGINGVRQNQPSFIVQPYDCIQVEHFICAIGAAGAAWPAYPPVTDLIEPEQEVAEEYAADEFNPDDAVSDSMDVDEWAENEQEELIAPSQQPEAKIVESQGSVSSLLNKIIERRRVIAAIGSVITLVSSSLVFTIREGREVTALMGRTDQVTAAESKIINHPVVASAAMPAVANTAGQTANQNNMLVSSAKDLLGSFGLSHLTVAAGSTPGEVIVSGYVEDAEHWRTISKMIQRDVAQLTTLTDQVETPKQSKQKLEQIIANHGLADSIQVFITNKGLVAKASLAPADEHKWAAIKQEYAQLSTDQPELHRVRDNANWLDIKSVSFGYESYVITTDGNRYVVGSVMKNGYTLEKITPEGLVLRNSEGVKHYPLNG